MSVLLASIVTVPATPPPAGCDFATEVHRLVGSGRYADPTAPDRLEEALACPVTRPVANEDLWAVFGLGREELVRAELVADPSDAAERSLRVLRFGEGLGEGGTLVQQLVGLALEEEATERLAAVAEGLPPADAATVTRELGAFLGREQRLSLAAEHTWMEAITDQSWSPRAWLSVRLARAEFAELEPVLAHGTGDEIRAAVQARQAEDDAAWFANPCTRGAWTVLLDGLDQRDALRADVAALALRTGAASGGAPTR